MERLMTGAKYFGLGCLLAVLGCTAAPPAATTQAADEAAVRQTDEDWSKAAQSKQVDPWVAFYAEDAVLLPPNDPKATGKDNIRKEIGLLLGLPGLALSWKPQKVEVSRSGDLAYTQGSYELSATDAHGKGLTDHGKTLEIWRKQ